MKWFLYLVATGLTSLAAYPAYVRIDTGLEGIVGWITAAITGGWFFGFVGNLIYAKWKEKNDAHPHTATGENEKPKNAARTNQFFTAI